jgi:uncharacterized protein
MRTSLSILAALALYAMSAGAAFSQTPLSCAAAPTSVCEDKDLAALEGERTALIQQLTSVDPQNAALAGEQTWADGLSACAEDVDCYRTAYLNHNEALRQAASALPGAATAAPTEAPADAPTVDEQIALDEVLAEGVREAAQQQRDLPARVNGQTYVPAGFPGWGFWTAIGVTFFLFWLLLRARARYRSGG